MNFSTSNRLLVGISILAAHCMLPQAEIRVRAQDEQPVAYVTEHLPESTLQIVESIYNTLSTNHITPPTRQQVYLSTARSIAQMKNGSVPRTLADRFSSVADPDELAKLLQECFDNATVPKYEESKFNQVVFTRVLADLDPKNQFITSKELRVRKQVQENRYVGIGIRLSFDQQAKLPEISEPFPGGAARKAGARPGDLILEVDGKPTDGVELGEVVQWLRGSDGSEVTVTLRNRGETNQREYTMVRAEVPFDTVQGYQRRDDDSWVFELPEKHDCSYLKIDTILGSTAAELATAWRKVGKSDTQQILIDMRTVEDADPHHVTLLADQLLPATTIGVVLDGNSKIELKTTDEHLETDGKKIVIVTRQKVSGPLFCLLHALRQQANIDVVCSNGELVSSDTLCRRLVSLDDELGAIDGLAYATCEPPQSHSRNHSYPETTFKPSNESLPEIMKLIRKDVDSENH